MAGMMGSQLRYCERCDHSFTETQWKLHAHADASIRCEQDSHVGRRTDAVAYCNEHRLAVCVTCAPRHLSCGFVTWVDGGKCRECNASGRVMKHGAVDTRTSSATMRCSSCAGSGYDDTLHLRAWIADKKRKEERIALERKREAEGIAQKAEEIRREQEEKRRRAKQVEQLLSSIPDPTPPTPAERPAPPPEERPPSVADGTRQERPNTPPKVPPEFSRDTIWEREAQERIRKAESIRRWRRVRRAVKRATITSTIVVGLVLSAHLGYYLSKGLDAEQAYRGVRYDWLFYFENARQFFMPNEVVAASEDEGLGDGAAPTPTIAPTPTPEPTPMPTVRPTPTEEEINSALGDYFNGRITRDEAVEILGEERVRQFESQFPHLPRR